MGSQQKNEERSKVGNNSAPGLCTRPHTRSGHPGSGARDVGLSRCEQPDSEGPASDAQWRWILSDGAAELWQTRRVSNKRSRRSQRAQRFAFSSTGPTEGRIPDGTGLVKKKKSRQKEVSSPRSRKSDSLHFFVVEAGASSKETDPRAANSELGKGVTFRRHVQLVATVLRLAAFRSRRHRVLRNDSEQNEGGSVNHASRDQALAYVAKSWVSSAKWCEMHMCVERESGGACTAVGIPAVGNELLHRGRAAISFSKKQKLLTNHHRGRCKVFRGHTRCRHIPQYFIRGVLSNEPSQIQVLSVLVRTLCLLFP